MTRTDELKAMSSAVKKAEDEKGCPLTHVERVEVMRATGFRPLTVTVLKAARTLWDDDAPIQKRWAAGEAYQEFVEKLYDTCGLPSVAADILLLFELAMLSHGENRERAKAKQPQIRKLLCEISGQPDILDHIDPKPRLKIVR